MAHIDQVNCLSYADLITKHGANNNNMKTDPQNCMKLNAAPTPYFNGGLVKVMSSEVQETAVSRLLSAPTDSGG